MTKIKTTPLKRVFLDKRFVFFVWMLFTFASIFKQYISGINNNFLIFRESFFHIIHQLDLYIPYPAEYFDTFYYSPVFCLLIAPFAVFPVKIGIILWTLALSLSLFYAVSQLPVEWKYKIFLFYIPLHELFISLSVAQTNTFIAALLVGAWIAIRREKNVWATLFIALGFFIKIYGIVGLAFFFFVKNKRKFILSFLVWCVVLFVLPMLITSPTYIVDCYSEWFRALVAKNNQNAVSLMQDISAMGMLRKITGDRTISNWIVLAPALFLFALQYVRAKKFLNNLNYQLGILASVLLFLVLFSSGSESTTYIIAVMGVSIWFAIQEKPFRLWTIVLLLFVVALTSLSFTDLVPKYIRYEYVRKYALKALPCLMVWLILVCQLVRGFILNKMLNERN